MKSNFLAQRSTPVILLRVGLGFAFLYAGISSLVTPNDWIGYLPRMITDNIDGAFVLKVTAVFEILLAVWLAIGKYLYLAGLVCAAMVAGIILANLSLLSITFRDVTLFFAALALASLTYNDNKR